ncbi:sigma-54-dependent Fis family transcriptional regulator [Hydrogenophilus thiooxidans]|uniref:sigma-54-dependent Fis family transcriptional regulator n=1 Tax=Hydrogenophilus thiooxidans TaxID=2820326 RepID=UPI001C233C1E|nr:response regulator [Hydrogenophilus thiooxidans]
MAKVLIVDDEVGIREWLSEILEDEGYRVATAANGSEGRQKLAEFAPEAILLDIWMPDCDGITLLKQWQSEMGSALPPVIMISGHATIETAVEATHHGAFGFLEKPISMQKLLDVLKKAIDRFRAQPKAETPLTVTRVPRPLAPVIDALNAKLQHDHAGLLYFPEPFYEQWLLRHLGEGQHTVWLTTETPPLSVDQVKQWRSHLVFANLGERANRMLAKNLSFLYQYAAVHQVRLIAAIRAWDAFAQWRPLVGEKLARVWEDPIVVPKRDESIALGTLVQEALEAELGQPLAWPEEAKRTIERIALDAEWTLDAWTQALLPLATEDRLDPAAIERALQRNQPENVSALFALPLKEAREAFERLYLERLLARTDLPVQRLADLAGLERTHFYRKLRQLGLSLRRKEEDDA